MGILQAYDRCVLCPNKCEVNRNDGVVGRCGETAKVRLAWSGLHRGEEPPVTGEHGSGMLFFCGCPLHCPFCQNHQISGGVFGGEPEVGVEFSIDELAHLMLELQAFGANNLNMVTGTQFIPSIAAALDIARSQGLKLPVVWNSSGYEFVEGLDMIDPYVSLYLVDCKTLDVDVAKKFCGLGRYAEAIPKVLKYLVRHHDKVEFCGDYDMRGILVRHLLFPGTMKATEQFLRWYAVHMKDNAWLSMMVQFVPPKQDVVFPKLTDSEYDHIIDLFEELGIENGFVQERGDDIKWIPDFRRDQPFPESFADALPYFLEKKHAKQTN